MSPILLNVCLHLYFCDSNLRARKGIRFNLLCLNPNSTSKPGQKTLANIITITYFSLTFDSWFMPSFKVGNTSSPYSWPLPSTHFLRGSFVT